MKKIPTIYLRDEKGNLTGERNPACESVFDGTVFATRKYDGTCVRIKDGVLWKRREVKKGKPDPQAFVLSEEDPNTGKRFGWVMCDRDDPGDAYHWEAFDQHGGWEDGTYELVGPKVQGNPEAFQKHDLVFHGRSMLGKISPSREKLATYFKEHPYEGIVWWAYENGKEWPVAKIKAKDLGIERTPLA